MVELTSIPIKGRVRCCLELLKSQELKGKVIVDVGASTGWLEKIINDEGVKAIIGVEPNKDSLVFAKKQVPGAKFVKGNAANIPLQSSLIDIVTLFDVLEHVPKGQEVAALKEAYRILKKNGVLLISTPNDHLILNLADPAWYFGHRHYTSNKIQELCSEAGFKMRDIKLRGSWWGVIYMLWFYCAKVLLGNKIPRNIFLEDKDDKGYFKKGIFTVYCVAEKIDG